MKGLEHVKPKNLTDEDIDDEDDSYDADLEDRTKDYSELKYIQKQLGELYPMVEKGFADKQEQNNTIDECWDMYHCDLNENQSYYGTSEVYVPIVRDAMEARETRFINTLFPQAGRYADVVGDGGRVPYDLIALLDHYVKKAHLRKRVAPAMIRSGDISGNYALYMEWIETTRHVTSKKKVKEVQTELGTEVEGSPEYDDMEHSKTVDQRPGVTVLDLRNLCVLPATSETIEEADTVAVRLRFTKAKIKKWVKDGIFTEKAGKALQQNMSVAATTSLPDTGKKAAAAAGVRTDSKGSKTAIIFQVWTKLKIRGAYRMMVTHFAGPEMILGCKRNPYWCDRVPVILQPVAPNPDSVYGDSQVKPVAALQYQANDVVNEGFDSAQYALLPIVMTDPEKNPRAGSMILAMASVWLCDPNSTKFAEFPPLWKDAFTIVGACKEQIFQTLGVNPAMLPHGNAGKKPSQAQVAQEQQVALESSSDNTTLMQEGVFSSVLEWFYELDYQYRTEAITVRKYGQFGLQATMDQVEPWQVRERYEFRWYGTESFKATQQVQQMISWGNVLRGMPPQMLNGRKIDLGPMTEYITEVLCGPRLASHTLIDQRHQMSMEIPMENQLIRNGFPVQVHPMDDDMAHIQGHLQEFEADMQVGNDPEFLKRGHILEHVKQAKEKAAAAQGAQPGTVGAPGGAGPGLPGQPRPGGAGQMPTGPQQPAGAVRPDNMTLAQPRKSAL
jgi:hypothetical protein